MQETSGKYVCWKRVISDALLHLFSMNLMRWFPSKHVRVTVLVVTAPTNVTLPAPTDDRCFMIAEAM